MGPRLLITAGLAFSAAGLAPLIWLTPSGRSLPPLLLAESPEGFETGIGSPPGRHAGTALHGVAPADTGVTAALTSAVSRVGSSIGAALLNALAVSATASCAAVRLLPATGAVATVHGFTVAMGWGTAILVVATVLVAIMINAPATVQQRCGAGRGDPEADRSEARLGPRSDGRPAPCRGAAGAAQTSGHAFRRRPVSAAR